MYENFRYSIRYNKNYGKEEEMSEEEIELLGKIEQFEQFCARKLADDLEREMEIHYWEYVEALACMTK